MEWCHCTVGEHFCTARLELFTLLERIVKYGRKGILCELSRPSVEYV